MTIENATTREKRLNEMSMKLMEDNSIELKKISKSVDQIAKNKSRGSSGSVDPQKKNQDLQEEAIESSERQSVLLAKANSLSADMARSLGEKMKGLIDLPKAAIAGMVAEVPALGMAGGMIKSVASGTLDVAREIKEARKQDKESGYDKSSDSALAGIMESSDDQAFALDESNKHRQSGNELLQALVGHDIWIKRREKKQRKIDLALEEGYAKQDAQGFDKLFLSSQDVGKLLSYNLDISEGIAQSLSNTEFSIIALQDQVQGKIGYTNELLADIGKITSNDILGAIETTGKAIENIDDRGAFELQNAEEERREAKERNRDLLNVLSGLEGDAKFSGEDDKDGLFDFLGDMDLPSGFAALGLAGLAGSLFTKATGLIKTAAGKVTGIGLVKTLGWTALAASVFEVVQRSVEAYKENPDAGVARAANTGISSIGYDIWDFLSKHTGIDSISSENIKKIDDQLTTGLFDFLDNASAGISDFFTDAWDGVSNVFTRVKDEIAGVGDAQDALSDAVGNPFSGMFDRIDKWLDEWEQNDPNASRYALTNVSGKKRPGQTGAFGMTLTSDRERQAAFDAEQEGLSLVIQSKIGGMVEGPGGGGTGTGGPNSYDRFKMWFSDGMDSIIDSKDDLFEEVQHRRNLRRIRTLDQRPHHSGAFGVATQTDREREQEWNARKDQRDMMRVLEEIAYLQSIKGTQVFNEYEAESLARAIATQKALSGVPSMIDNTKLLDKFNDVLDDFAEYIKPVGDAQDALSDAVGNPLTGVYEKFSLALSDSIGVVAGAGQDWWKASKRARFERENDETRRQLNSTGPFGQKTRENRRQDKLWEALQEQNRQAKRINTEGKVGAIVNAPSNVNNISNSSQSISFGSTPGNSDPSFVVSEDRSINY